MTIANHAKAGLGAVARSREKSAHDTCDAWHFFFFFFFFNSVAGAAGAPRRARSPRTTHARAHAHLLK